MMLESNLHPNSAFLTLTYSDTDLPITSRHLGTLNPKHLQDWLKRFRKAIEPSRIRFFAVGEYGETTERPHYHAVIFGFQSCLWGTTRSNRQRCCSQCELVQSTWQHGQVYLGTFGPESAAYVAGYVTKKLTQADNPWLQGRHPEFSRMSRNPGLAADALHDVASTLLEFDLEQTQTDVPSSLRHGSREMPLGRYLQQRLRVLVGRDAKAPQEVLDKIQEELRPLREAAFENSQSFQKTVVEANAQKRMNFYSKTKLKTKRKPL